MQFQIVSDVHLETYTNGSACPTIRPIAPYLILAGDVGDPFSRSYEEFMEDASTKFEKVFIITGNHEYYGHSTMDEVEGKIQQVLSALKKKNVHFLQNSSYMFPENDVAVWGSTLWTHIPSSAAIPILRSIRDYRSIPLFSIQKCRSLHTEATHHLKQCLKAHPQKKWVVVTHHLPQVDLIDETYRKYKELNYAFASDVEKDLVDHPSIEKWIYGHTHTPNSKGKFVCNPWGYPGENTVRDIMINI